MAIPPFSDFLLPLLKFASTQQKPFTFREPLEYITREFHLSSDDLREINKSGQLRIENRLSWGLTYLKKAVLLEAPHKRFNQITDRGRQLLATNLSYISIDVLMQYPEFAAFQKRRTKPKENGSESYYETKDFDLSTPLESMEQAYESMREELADELLERTHTVALSSFKRIICELLSKMGYGGTKSDIGTSVSLDKRGIACGLIKVDNLGLERVYLEAVQRQEKPIEVDELKQFTGELHLQRVEKGIFITTSSFSSNAQKYADKISNGLVLIDGRQLAELMIEYDVGVSTISLYPVKAADSTFFDE